MKVVSFLRFAAVAAACTVACTASAAPPTDPAAADALFQKGREAAEKGEWSVACPKFAESQRLDPAPGTLLNLADCEEHLGQLASAHDHFKTALETMSANDDRIPFAKARFAALDKQVPHLTLNASADLPSDARVTRDDVQLGTASFGLAIPVNPGTHVVVVTAPGHKERRTALTLKAGEAETLALHPGEIDRSAVVVPPPRPTSTRADASEETTASSGGSNGNANGNSNGNSNGKRTAGIALTLLGGAGIGAGIVTGILVLGKKSTIDDPTHCTTIPGTSGRACDPTGVGAASSGKTLSVVSTVGFAAGGAVLATGVFLLLTSGGPSKTATVVSPDAYAGGGGLRLVQTF